MKVIHLISGGDTGGAKTHVHSLLAHLGQSIEVTMVCFVDGPFSEEARALGIRTIILHDRSPVRTLRTLAALVRGEGFDLIHCHGARGNMMGGLLARMTGLPVLSTVHSDYRLDYLGRPFSRLTYGTINTLALRRMDYCVGVSDATTDLLIGRGFDPDRLFTIYNGLDFAPRPPRADRAAFFRSVGLDAGADCVVVGIAARLNPVKDIATLVRAFALAHKTCPQLRLLIAGDGQQGDMLRALAAELGVSNEVCFAGWVEDTDSFYHAIDINSLTSLSETFPYALTEGARMHLPTVSSRVGGVPYLIDHAVTGLLFEAGDVQALAAHLTALAGDPALRARLGEALYQKGKADFSLVRTVERQLEIYHEILRRSAHPRAGRDGVLVCGAYGRGNAGDDAILEAIITELRALDGDMPIWVLSRSPADTRVTYRVNSIYTFNVPSILRRMGKTRLYINGGGSLMQDVTSRRSLWFYLFTIWAAKRRGNKVIMYGCGIGPVQYPSNRRLVKRVLDRQVDTITLRDTHSRRELADMKITVPEIILAADPTVILPAAPRAVVDGILQRHGMDPDGRYIGFTLRPWPGFDAKAPAFAEAADYAWERYGLTPVFLPIESRLDVAAAQKVSALMTAPFHALPETGPSAHAIGLFSRMEAVVSMRLHGLVFAAGQGVALVGVVYDQKVSSFLDYIGQDLYNELADITPELLKARIDAACLRRGDAAFLSRGVERLREVELRNREAAKNLLALS